MSDSACVGEHARKDQTVKPKPVAKSREKKRKEKEKYRNSDPTQMQKSWRHPDNICPPIHVIQHVIFPVNAQNPVGNNSTY